MGNYTRVVDLNGDVLQAYMCGAEDYATFKIGDDVPFKIDPEAPGCAQYPDGAFEARWEARERDAVVVVKGHRIVAVMEITHRDYHADDFVPFCEIIERVEKIFNVQPLPRDLWPEEQWTEKERWERFCEEKRKAEKYDGPLLLRAISKPLYDQDIDPEFSAHYERMRQLARKK